MGNTDSSANKRSLAAIPNVTSYNSEAFAGLLGKTLEELKTVVGTETGSTATISGSYYVAATQQYYVKVGADYYSIDAANNVNKVVGNNYVTDLLSKKAVPAIRFGNENRGYTWKYKVGNDMLTVGSGDAPDGSSTVYKDPPAIKPGNPSEYRWNLPPHAWSMPTVMDNTFLKSGVNDKDSSGKLKPKISDAYRRGRIWWRANDPSIELYSGDPKLKKKLVNASEDRKFGFQFLWNPETFNTSTAVQLDATPTAGDRLIAVAGAFPATETLSFNIRLDRTNDFACAAGDVARAGQTSQLKKGLALKDRVNKDYAKNFIKYYQVPTSFRASSSPDSLSADIVDLLQRGTIADIEFLYRAINGIGPGTTGTLKDLSSQWINARGIATSDIGFLMPTLLNIDIGPLSYQGYVTSLSVTHTAFTPEMTPIRSDVTISLSLLATVGVSSTKYNN